ncbi:MAG: PKD domain-containing protein [Proteobacteria bacterium]|nr:PKD domain-containing protein [Pseudomonadota bacterium]
MNRQYIFKPFLCLIPWVTVFFVLCIQALPVISAELLIIVPYNPTGSVVQQDEAWVQVAEQFETYKEETGMDTQVFTLEFINRAYDTEGADEPERIKRLIYNQAMYSDARYVMLVGDTGIFPIRYQYFGYSSVGLTHWAWNDGTSSWYPFDSYGFFPCDAYYSNLWDDEDPARNFDNWDADGDGFYGEKYYDNFRGTDENTIHPDVALGRIPCKNPDEFFRYMIKVMSYENNTPYAEKKALFIGGGFSTSQRTKLNIGTFMESLLDISYLLGESGEPWDFTDGGRTTSDVNAHDTIIDYVNDHYPQFINYAGHGSSGSLAEPGFRRSDVSALTNAWQPSIVIAPGSCSTARYAQSDSDSSPRLAPVTLAADENSMAEAFLTDYSDGGVIYIGSLVSNQPPGLYFDSRIFRAVESGLATMGSCYRQAIEDFIDEYNLDTATCSSWIHESDWPDADVGGRWNWFPPARFHSVYKVQLFGDPSLRINGVTGAMTPPTTTAFYTPWVNRQNLTDHLRETFYVDVHLSPFDAEIPIRTTRYNYSLDGTLTQWRDGTDFSVPIYLTASLEGNEGYGIRYYSINELGHTEMINQGAISFDFTLPQSEITATYGDDDPVVVDGVLAFDADSMRIQATDNLSGVSRIDYRFGSGSSYHSSPGPSVTVEFPCFYMTDYEFSWRAVDGAGNEEEWHTTSLRVPSCSDFLEVRERLSNMLEAEAGRHMFNFPPSYVDDTLNLGFQVLDGNDPFKVVFQYSGPFHEDYQSHVWENISEAVYNEKTDRWESNWNTQSLGIENGFYWVRAMPEFPTKSSYSKAQEEPWAPHLLWVNTMRNQNQEIDLLAISSPSTQVQPGDTIRIAVVFHHDGQGEAQNARVRLLVDEELYDDLTEDDVLRTRDNLKMDEPLYFELTLKDENLPDLDHITFKAAMTAQGIGLLTSDYLFMNLIKRPIAVDGTVRDTKGNPLVADLELTGKSGTLTQTTRLDGSYIFLDIPEGTYQLSLSAIPRGYRPVLPKDGTLIIRAKGDNINQHFILSGRDLQSPAFTHLSDFDETAQSGTLSGMACDRNFGSGVSRITVSVKDEIAQLFLTANGTWETNESLIPADQMDDCSVSRPDLMATAIQGNLPADTQCVTFSLDLPAQADLAQGRNVMYLHAQDRSGNQTVHELRSTFINAGFTCDNTTGPAPLTVSFTNQSSGRIDFNHWDFGDNETSEASSPTHTFNAPGVYDVSLMIAGPDSSDSELKSALITVTEKSGSPGDGGDDGGGGGCFIVSLSDPE